MVHNKILDVENTRQLLVYIYAIKNLTFSHCRLSATHMRHLRNYSKLRKTNDSYTFIVYSCIQCYYGV